MMLTTKELKVRSAAIEAAYKFLSTDEAKFARRVATSVTKEASGVKVPSDLMLKVIAAEWFVDNATEELYYIFPGSCLREKANAFAERTYRFYRMMEG